MKVAVITGAGRGVGRSAALRLAGQGSAVVLAYDRDREAVIEVQDEIRWDGGKALAVPLDIASLPSIEAFSAGLEDTLHRAWGVRRIDALVCDATPGAPDDAGSARRDDMRADGSFALMRRLSPLMNDGGHILKVSSVGLRNTGDGPCPAMAGAFDAVAG